MTRAVAAIAAALFWATANAAEIEAEALATLLPADVVILGEVHDNPQHHRNQATALRALALEAVVFEMLDTDQAASVNDGQVSAEALEWAGSGWPDWAIYAPVFDAIGDARVYGMALGRDAVIAAMRDGPDAVMADAARFNLDAALPAEEQAAREAEQMAAHCDALPAEMLPGMVAAQRLRDAAFAHTVLQALDDTGGPVAVVTGNGHARTDRAIPAMIAVAEPEVSVLSIGQIEDGSVPEAPPYDQWLITDRAERGDPCAAFTDG